MKPVLLLAALVLASPSEAQRSAVRAGTIHLVENGEVLHGATILLDGGRITAIGTDVEVPPDATIIDYGPDAVVVPGFVAADSSLIDERGGERTANPNVRAIDGFDFYGDYASPLSAGVTSAYLTPARNRLLSGQGAVVKLGGDESARRVLAAPATLHGAISAEARRTSAYWEPPIPATSDVGIGVPLEQLPKTTMGAIVALRELLALAQTGEDSELYGPGIADTLAAAIEARLPWRITARDEDELLALLAFQSETQLPLVVHGADDAGLVALRLAAAGVGVIYESDFRPNAYGLDRGKDPNTRLPDYSTPAQLVRAGVPVAISGRGSWDLRFAAALASRGGLDEGAALRAITLTPAELYGVAERVGSLAPGKDADLCVLNGSPLDVGSSVLATWVGGRVAWERSEAKSTAVVVAVDELHVGDGRVLRPGQVLMRDGVIVEVGESVAHPSGARVVRGSAAMPGIIDGLGHLGLEGTTKVPATDFPLGRIVGPGDDTDRRVAQAGVTTVVLSPRKASNSGAPMMAYKPASESDERIVVRDVAALRVEWSDSNRYESGDKVRELLDKVVEYDAKWREYEEAIAAWTEPASEPEVDEDAEADGEEEDDEEKGDEKDEDEEDEGEGDEPETSVTGLWTSELLVPPMTEPSALRLRLLDEDGDVRGNLRCDAISDDLVLVEGRLEDGSLSVRGLGRRGFLRVDAELVLPEKKKGKKKRKKKDDDEEEAPAVPRLVGTLELPGDSVAIDLALAETGYPIAKRPAPLVEEPAEEAKPPKGMPKEPRHDSKLEPLRAAMRGEATVVVEVGREDEILECVDAFRAAGIRPVLLGAKDAWRVADRIAPFVAGVLPNQPVVTRDSRGGLESERNRYAELQAAGIRVGFSSFAEEGAADLPLMAAFAVSQGMSPAGALRALTADVAAMFAIDRVGLLERGRDADLLVFDGSPFDLRSSVERVFVDGVEVL